MRHKENRRKRRGSVAARESWGLRGEKPRIRKKSSGIPRDIGCEEDENTNKDKFGALGAQQTKSTKEEESVVRSESRRGGIVDLTGISLHDFRVTGKEGSSQKG